MRSCPYATGFRSETMQRWGFLITGSIIFAAGVVLGVAALGADTSSPRRNPNLPEFPAAVGAHETRADSESALGLQNAMPSQAQIEGGPLQMIPPTRSSFMAAWQKVSGAIDYRLDVSTSASFDSYVDGYHDLDVGNVTGRVVTGLSQGTTYYYRVSAYDATGTVSYADAITGYDATANTSLPTSALSANIRPTSAIGRAVRLNTPGGLTASGTIGGSYDGIVTLNSSVRFQFSRPTSGSNLDGQRATEHEMDEVLGFGSRLNIGGSDLRPQELLSWSSAGVRNLTSSGTRYFSINRGPRRIVYFNQNSNGDFGDWQSTACPQAQPYVQNAFSCAGQYSDVTLTSPEAINLDVIGYNLINSPAPAPTDFNGDGKPDWVLYNASTQQTAIYYMNNNVRIASPSGPTLPAGSKLVAVADFNRDGHPDYLLFNP